jgi:hypothetical protein
MPELGPFVAAEIPAPLVVTFTDNAGEPIDLTGYDAVWQYRVKGDVVELPAEVTDDEAGEATHTWGPEDLSVAGNYVAYMWVSNGANRFASEAFTFRVHPGLGPPSI